MTKYEYQLKGADKTIYGGGSTFFSSSGTTSGNESTNWRVHVQNIEVMYVRKTQYKASDGTADFNYLDTAYTIEASREHIYLNASSGDTVQYQTLDLISDSSSGGLGTSGVIRTRLAGLTRRAVRAGDAEVNNRVNGNCITGRMPGAYDTNFDVSANTNSTVLDMLVHSKQNCQQFEINLVDL